MKATFCKTKAGNGFKIAFGEKWLFTSEEYLLKVIRGEAKSCQFRSIEDGSDTRESSYSAFDEEETRQLDIFDF